MKFKLGFVGGSITAGYGWDLSDPIDSSCHWVNQVHSLPQFSNYDLVNHSIVGGSNDNIFTNTIDLIASYKELDVLFCCWVTYPRYSFDVGFELYNTKDNIQNPTVNDHNLNTGTITAKYINNIKFRFSALHHPHHEIVKIVRYHNIINQLARKNKIKIYHVNDSCQWDQNYFARLEGSNVLPNDYTTYTKIDMLNINNRADSEISDLYKKLHDDYDAAGGIDPNNWINLYDSFLNLQTDYNHDNHHPGKNSNITYFNLVKTHLEIF